MTAGTELQTTLRHYLGLKGNGDDWVGISKDPADSSSLSTYATLRAANDRR
jgi:hypothetical protein